MSTTNHPQSTTRGLPFDPAAAIAARARRSEREAREFAAQAAAEKRAYGRKLDEIEAMWRNPKPAPPL